mmetsp:Transcript_28685/g.80853  ORF Transcript_28685/g.80853 Transcript_28685/m.80853 type:complete len:127 (+) Transcript_28685:82-462(+)
MYIYVCIVRSAATAMDIRYATPSTDVRSLQAGIRPSICRSVCCVPTFKQKNYEDIFSTQPRVIHPRHVLRHIPCKRMHPPIIGFSIVAIARKTNESPMDPPGRKLMRYQSSASSCAPDAAMTSAYP